MQIICNSLFSLKSGHNSVVEYKLPKLGVASSNLVARSISGRLSVGCETSEKCFGKVSLLSADSGNVGAIWI
jgi:hypothetical protein